MGGDTWLGVTTKWGTYRMYFKPVILVAILAVALAVVILLITMAITKQRR